MRIGFACKYIHPDRTLRKKDIDVIEGRYNGRSTTATWCRDNPRLFEERLWSIAIDNCRAVYNMIEYVGSLEPMARMVRLGGDLFPLYTHDDYSWFYKQIEFGKTVRPLLAAAGKLARQSNVRLSMHPGQFVVLASDRPEVVDASIREFEYQTDIVKMLGYARKQQDFKCNVHLSGKLGAQGFRTAYGRLSPEARKIITLENDEFGCKLDDILTVRNIVPIVLDIHHHWIASGTYIRPNDSRVQQVVDSWRGVRPTMHYAYSRAEILLAAGHDDSAMQRRPNMSELNQPLSKLRQHSDWYPNAAANRWALKFLPQFDIMCESKMKNLASSQLIEYYHRLY
jgi:UV DNA damage endonuclease